MKSLGKHGKPRSVLSVTPLVISWRRISNKGPMFESNELEEQ
jgi:hypothetical protein